MESLQQSLHESTVISLTFDDTFADNAQVATILAPHDMHATFYVNSGRIGQSGYLTQAQLESMEDAGHEIGGHTVSHANLTALEPDEMRRQVCNDRNALLNAGFVITSFAYPFSANNATVRQVIDDCGYNSARLVGGIVSPGTCSGCPYANPMPPGDPYQVRTPDSVKTSTSLATLQGYVTQAENNGGGWVPLVFHHVCNGCNELAVSPATLDAFVDWLALRESRGTVVRTVDEVIGGAVQPPVEGPPPVEPPPSSGNMLQNPSLETDANGDQIPDCWQRGGSGTNSATYALTSNAYQGSVAQRITMTSYTSGARRLVSRLDLGTCAPAVTPGHRYTVSARYIANTQPVFTIHYRNASGGWVWFAQSPRLPTSSSYALGTYTTPALPSGATAISVGMSILGIGSLTMDAFTLVDAAGTGDTTAPTVSLTSPAAGATVSGTVQLAANASDGGGIARVEFLVNGSVVGTDTSSPYSSSWNSDAFAGETVTLTARAFDTAGNSATSASRQVTVAGGTGDTTPPTVAVTSPADGATVSGTVPFSADASDASGIARVEMLVNGSIIATEYNLPYEIAWDTSPYAGQTVTLAARAFDTAGNSATSASRQVTVAGTPSANLLTNASLETDANGDQIPDCWQRGGSGTNAATFSLTSNAFDGSVAQRIDMTSYTSGARRLVSRLDAGTCAPAASPGRRYTVTARYIATGQPVFTIHYRDTAGTWRWFAQSARLPTSSTYALGTYTTPALPADATAISVGLSIISLGSLTMDSFTLVEAGN